MYRKQHLKGRDPTTVRTVYATSKKYRSLFGYEPFDPAHKRLQERQNANRRVHPLLVDPLGLNKLTDDWHDIDDDTEPNKAAAAAVWEEFLIQHDELKREHYRQFKRR